MKGPSCQVASEGLQSCALGCSRVGSLGGRFLCGSRGAQQLAALSGPLRCLLLEPQLYGCSLCSASRLFYGLCVPGATPQTGAQALDISQSLCRPQWHMVASPSCVPKEGAGAGRGGEARARVSR